MGTKFVWPWCGVLANIPVHIDEKTGRRTGKSTSGLRDQLILDGFNTKKVSPIWNSDGFSGFALVEFERDIDGFDCAWRFHRTYNLNDLGKRDWLKGVPRGENRLFGWRAQKDDYNDSGPLGKELRKRFELKTLAEYQAEEDTKSETRYHRMIYAKYLKINKRERMWADLRKHQQRRKFEIINKRE